MFGKNLRRSGVGEMEDIQIVWTKYASKALKLIFSGLVLLLNRLKYLKGESNCLSIIARIHMVKGSCLFFLQTYHGTHMNLHVHTPRVTILKIKI